MSTPGMVSALAVANTASANDILLLTKYPFTPDSSKQIAIDDFFGTISVPVSFANTVSFAANVSITASLTANNLTVTTANVSNLNVASDGIVISSSFTPANSAITGMSVGQFSWDANYLYVKVATGVIKRVALVSF